MPASARTGTAADLVGDRRRSPVPIGHIRGRISTDEADHTVIPADDGDQQLIKNPTPGGRPVNIWRGTVSRSLPGSWTSWLEVHRGPPAQGGGSLRAGS